MQVTIKNVGAGTTSKLRAGATQDATPNAQCREAFNNVVRSTLGVDECKKTIQVTNCSGNPDIKNDAKITVCEQAIDYHEICALANCGGNNYTSGCSILWSPWKAVLVSTQEHRAANNTKQVDKFLGKFCTEVKKIECTRENIDRLTETQNFMGYCQNITGGLPSVTPNSTLPTSSGGLTNGAIGVAIGGTALLFAIIGLSCIHKITALFKGSSSSNLELNSVMTKDTNVAEI